MDAERCRTRPSETGHDHVISDEGAWARAAFGFCLPSLHPLSRHVTVGAYGTPCTQLHSRFLMPTRGHKTGRSVHTVPGSITHVGIGCFSDASGTSLCYVTDIFFSLLALGLRKWQPAREDVARAKRITDDPEAFAKYMLDYNTNPDPPPLPNYYYNPADLEHWDTYPLPRGLVFTENALAITRSIITPAVGQQLVNNFHNTGEHVNAPAELLSYLDTQFAATGSWDFMHDPCTLLPM